MDPNDKYAVNGLKSLAITKGIAYLESQIKQEDLDEPIREIVDYFPDKHAKVVIDELKQLLRKFHRRLTYWEVQLEQGIIPTKAEPDGKEDEKKQQVSRNLERIQKTHRKNSGKNKRN